jgi:hypothetical protein
MLALITFLLDWALTRRKWYHLQGWTRCLFSGWWVKSGWTGVYLWTLQDLFECVSLLLSLMHAYMICRLWWWEKCNRTTRSPILVAPSWSLRSLQWCLRMDYRCQKLLPGVTHQNTSQLQTFASKWMAEVVGQVIPGALLGLCCRETLPGIYY